MIKAVLVDDEMLVLNYLEKVVGETNDIQVIGAFTDPDQALSEIPQLKPDVLFLDVDMPEMSGIELGTKLMEGNHNEEMAIVFVTAYEQYAIRAFELNAIHYILKPVDSQSVDEIVNRVHRKKEIERREISVNGEIFLFGNMHLRLNDHQTELMTAKLEELFALLILHREIGISKWQIIDILWEDSSMEKSQQNLYTMMFRLKKKLRNAGIKIDIQSGNSIYKINIGEVYCDVIEFDRLIAKKLQVNKTNIEQLERAISLYKGDLLEQKDYLWCIPIREKYYQQFFHLVLSVATYYKGNEHTTKLRKLHQDVKHLLIKEDYDELIM